MSNEELAIKYIENGDTQALHMLFENFKPLIRTSVMAFSGSTVSDSVLEAEAKILITKAVKSYVSGRGSLAGHIKRYMQGLNRVANSASPIYIPIERASKFQMFVDEQEGLEAKLKRAPTITEMADHLSMPMREVERFTQETGRKVTSGVDLNGVLGREMDVTPHFKEFIYNRIQSPSDKKIYEHVYGLHGKEILETNTSLARAAGVSESGVRNAKGRIIKLIREFE